MELYPRVLHLSPTCAASRTDICTRCVFRVSSDGTIAQDFAFAPYERIFTAPRGMRSGTIAGNFAFVPYRGSGSAKRRHAMRAVRCRRWDYMPRFCICPLLKNLHRSARNEVWNYSRKFCICPLYVHPTGTRRAYSLQKVDISNSLHLKKNKFWRIVYKTRDIMKASPILKVRT